MANLASVYGTPGQLHRALNTGWWGDMTGLTDVYYDNQTRHIRKSVT